jgi:hypothetical protein
MVTLVILSYMETDSTNLTNVGEALLEHARGAEFSARGAIEVLYPYIVQASKRLSTRAISRYLEENHGRKISFVTIGKALRNPQKYWNAYFDRVEASAWIVAEAHDKPLRSFMSESEKYQGILETKPVLTFDSSHPEQEQATRAQEDYEEARRNLDEAWFCFDDEILEEARCFLLKRFAEKPTQPKEEE